MTLAADGSLVDVDLWRAFFTPAFPTEATHVLLSAYASVGFAVLGIHAAGLRRDPASRFHRAALRVVLPLVIVVMPLQMLSGDSSAKHVAEYQPAKLAAAEALFHTERGAPVVIGGIPDEDTGEVRFGVHVPYLLSLLGKGDFDAEITGLDDVPEDERPPVLVPHLAFELMIGCGIAMLGVASWAAVLLLRRRRLEESTRFLRACTLAAPLGLVAVEAGWTVTEVGRQPFILHGILRTSDAVTPMPGLVVTFAASVVIYALLGAVTAVMLRRHVLRGAPNAAKEEPT